MKYPVGLNKEGSAVIGVFANRTHEIVPVNDCLIQNEKANKVAKNIIDAIKKYNLSVYDETKGEGLIRHVVIKTSHIYNEIMVIIVINGDFLFFFIKISSTLLLTSHVI